LDEGFVDSVFFVVVDLWCFFFEVFFVPFFFVVPAFVVLVSVFTVDFSVLVAVDGLA
jgi:hypothetical protein